MRERRPSFRLVYRLGDHWHWHANMTHQNVPPRSWTNRAGNTRTHLGGVVRSWMAWLWLRARIER